MALGLALLDELLGGRTVAVVCAVVIDGEHVLVLLVADLEQRGGAHDARVGDHDVEVA